MRRRDERARGHLAHAAKIVALAVGVPRRAHRHQVTAPAEIAELTDQLHFLLERLERSEERGQLPGVASAQ